MAFIRNIYYGHKYYMRHLALILCIIITSYHLPFILQILTYTLPKAFTDNTRTV